MGSTSIYRWIQRFVPMISDYAQSLTPELSETWHADELFVKMKGGENEKASKVSKSRDVGGASRAFMEARKNAGQSQPERILTDGLDKYKEGIAFGFAGVQKPEHVARMGVGKPHANNNRVERLNGTLRERVKVQRGWKSHDSKIAEGQRLHYSFVRPHSALEGQTPAERAGIDVMGDNKTLGLLRNALTTPSGTPEETTECAEQNPT